MSKRVNIFRSFRGPRRVSNKIILLVLSLELFSLSLWGSLTYEGSKEELIKTINLHLNEAAFRTKTQIGNFLLPIKLQVKMIVEGMDIDFTQGDQATSMFHYLIRTRPEIEEISLLDEFGKEQKRISRLTSYGPKDFRSLADMALVKSAFNNVSKTSQIRFSEYLEPQLQLATPIAHRGSVKNVILTLVNLKWLWDVVQEQKIGDTGYVYVVDNDLHLIGHNDQSLVLSQLNLYDTSVPEELFRHSGDHDFSIYKNFYGVQVTGVAQFDSTNHWWVVVEQPVKEGLAPLDRIVNRFLFVFLVAVAVTLGAVIIFSRIITRPLANFEDGILRIGEGNRNVSIPVPKNTELASIATSFNTMAENLDTQITELVKSERRVRESEEKYRLLSSTLQQHVENATKKLLDTNHHLETALMRAEQANKAKSTFLANMSHELRTPLNAIIGYSELLREDNTNPENEKDLEKIIHAGNHLLNIINNLLDLSKIEAGKMDISIEDIHVPKLIESTIDTVQPLIDANQNKLIVKCADAAQHMKSDPTKLVQSLVNLLSNAAKFTKHGEIYFNVSLTEKDNIKFEVSDTGIGMSREQTEAIFNVFAQADQTIQQRFGGSGLGLAISRHYCNLLGGDISVDSTVGIGTTFVITVPRVLKLSSTRGNDAAELAENIPQSPDSLAS